MLTSTRKRKNSDKDNDLGSDSLPSTCRVKQKNSPLHHGTMTTRHFSSPIKQGWRGVLDAYSSAARQYSCHFSPICGVLTEEEVTLQEITLITFPVTPQLGTSTQTNVYHKRTVPCTCWITTPAALPPLPHQTSASDTRPLLSALCSRSR